jgi:uncharacterized protein YprB with RNaseH-like and TPR domain
VVDLGDALEKLIELKFVEQRFDQGRAEGLDEYFVTRAGRDYLRKANENLGGLPL